MSDDQQLDAKAKKDRSPSFPFISLPRAVERAETLHAAHRREPARLVAVGQTWGYGAKSSGLLQTVAALKQYGLLEDLGSGEDRKVMLTDLARRIILDTRPGAREAALQEAGKKPRLLAEYLTRWAHERPSDSHCISELHLDRGFTPDAARLFMRVFDETVSYAHLAADDDWSPAFGSSLPSEAQEIPSARAEEARHETSAPYLPDLQQAAEVPFSQRFKVTVAADQLAVTAVLRTASEVDKLIRILEANKALLDDAEA